MHNTHTTRQYKTSGKLNCTSGGAGSDAVPMAKIHLPTCKHPLTHLHGKPSIPSHGRPPLCRHFHFSVLKTFERRAVSKGAISFASISDSTGLFSQAVSSAQLAGLRTSNASSAEKSELNTTLACRCHHESLYAPFPQLD